MNRSFSAPNIRIFISCLLTFLILMAPIASVAGATRRSQPPSPRKTIEVEKTAAPEAPVKQNAPAPQPLVALAPVVTATLTDNVATGTKVNPGSTINYTAVIGNAGAASPADDALGVAFGGTLDSNTTLVPGSVHASPIAFNDTYNWIGNTTLDTSARSLPSVTANDMAITDSFTLTPIAGGATSQGGTVTLNASGHFVYTPQAGDSGADTFTYTITNTADGTLVGTGTVTINLNGRVWYVQNALVNGDGTSSSPFNNPTSASNAANQATDIIYIFSNLPNPLLNGNFVLEGGQQLLGQGVALVVSAITLFPAGTAPTITNSTGNGITLNNTNGGNTVRGLIVGDTSGIDIVGTGGTGFGTLTLNSVTLNGTGRPLHLDTGTLAATFDGITATAASGGQGINLANIGGSMTVTNGTSITNPGSQGILVGTTTANINFGNVTVSGGTDAVSFQNNSTGVFTIGTLTISGNTGTGFLHAVGGGAVTVNGATNITNPGGTGISIQNSNANISFAGTTVNKGASAGTGVNLGTNATRTITFSSLSVTTNDGSGVVASGGGTFNVTSAASSQITSTNGPALSLTGMTVGASFTTLTSTNSTTTGILVNTTTGTLTVNNGGGVATSVQNSNGRGIDLTSSSATFNFGNTNVTGSTTDAGIVASSSGAVTFGDLDVAPDPTRAGLIATSNGLITSTSGTFTTTTNSALAVTATPLAMTLDSVTANTSAGGGSGITLTSSTGSLVIGAGSLTGGVAAPFSVSGGSVGVTYSGGMSQALAGPLVSVAAGHTGTITFQTGTLSATGGTGLQFSNADGTYNFNGTTTLGGGDAGLDILLDSAGTFTFVSTTSITSPSGIAFNVDGGVSTSTCNVTYSGNITQANNAAMVSVTNHNTGTITFQTGTLSATNGTGVQFNNADSTTSYNFNGTTTLNGGDAGIDITNGSAGTFSFNANTGITNPTNEAIVISGGTQSVTYSGSFTKTNGTRGLLFQNNTGGTISINGASATETKQITTSGAGNCIDLLTNTGTTINFTGNNLVLSAGGTGNGFTATGGGTVTVQGTGNTITTASGNALNVANTNIGLSGLTFLSINSNGGTNGIILNTTGVTAGTHGGLSVTGTGTTAGSGGTIQNKVQGAIFTSTRLLSLKNMAFTNANSGNGTLNNVDNSTFNSAAQAAINMSSVSTVTLDNLQLTNGAQVGLNGQTISDMTITGVTITNFGNAIFEGAVRLFNLTGTCSITNSTFSFSEDSNVDIRNNTGTLNLSVLGNPLGSSFSQFSDTQTKTNGNAGLAVTAVGASSVVNLVVKSSKFLRLKTVGIATFARDNSTMNVDITGSGVNANGNTFDCEVGIGRAIDLNAEDTADLNFNITNNPLIKSRGGAGINVFAINDPIIQGRISNNPNIQQGGATDPASALNIHPEDNADGKFEIRNNVISNIGTNPGIFIFNHGDGLAGVENGRIDATLSNNSITIAGQPTAGIQTSAGTNDGDDNDVCANLGSAVAGSGNVVNLGPGGVNNIGYLARVGNNDGARLFLEGFTTSVNNTWNIRGNTPLNSTLEFHAAGATPPLAGICALPGHPVALAIPTSNRNDNYAQTRPESPVSNTVAVTARRVFDSARITAGVSGMSVKSAGVVSPATSFATKQTQPQNQNPVVSHQGLVITQQTARNSTVAFNRISGSAAAMPIAVKKEIRSHHASIRRNPQTKAAVNSRMLSPLAGETINLSIGTLPAGKTVTIRFAATVSTTPSASQVSMQGTVTATGGISVLTDDPDTATVNDPTVTLIALPDLTIDKSHTGDFTRGQSKTYNIAVTNSGDASTTGTITVTDTLPAGLTPTNAVGSGWNCNIAAQTVTCDRSDAQPPGALPAITLTVDVDSGATTPLTNTASVSGGGEINTANNSDGDLTNIIDPPCVTAPANMVAWYPGDGNARDIAGGDDGTPNGGATFAAGKVLNGFSLDGTDDYINAPDTSGVSPTQAITIDAWVNPDTLVSDPNGRTIVSKFDSTTAGQSSYLLRLNNGGNILFAVYGPGGENRFVITPSAISSGVFTHVTATFDNATDEIKVYVNGVDTASPVGVGSTAITSINDSTTPLRIGALKEASLGGFFDGVIDEVEIFNVALTQPQINSIFTADDAGKCKPSDLKVTKSHADPFAQNSAGNIYTITVHNDGPGVTSGTTTVTDSLPAGLTATGMSGSGWTCSTPLPAAGAASLVCTSTAAIASGADFPAITLIVSAGVGSPSVTNNVTVSGGGEMDASDDTAADLTNLTPVSDLEITSKTDDVDPVNAGSNITYTINFINNGPSTASSVTVTDTVPSGTTLVSASTVSSGWSRTDLLIPGSTGDVVFTGTSIASGATATFTIVVKVNSNVTSQISNTATAAGANDPNLANNSKTQTTNTGSSADIQLTSKTDTPDPVIAGNQITYTVNFVNNGPSDASTVKVTDVTPANTTFASASTASAGWARSDTLNPGDTGTVEFSNSSVPAGATASFTIVLNVLGGTPDATVITNTANTTTATSDPTMGNNSASTTTTVATNLALTVNTTGDQADANVGDRDCDVDLGTGGSQCTLRAAIQETNASPTADTIGFSLAGGSTILLGSALPAIAGDVVISATVALTVSGNGTSRVFTVSSGTVAINMITITGGLVSGGHGAGLLVTGGDVTVKDVLFNNNQAVNGNGGALAVTGGLLTVLNSTISGNTATNGGGIYNGGVLTLVNDTITNNNANGDVGGGPGSGTGIGGGINVAANPTLVRNSIIAGNTAFTSDPNVSGTIPLGGNNITSGNPGLAALANNGGPTQTHALLPGSIALDAGNDAHATTAGLTNDQRGTGFSRFVDGPDVDAVATVDIGAFEAQVWVEDIADRAMNEDGTDSFTFGVGGVSITSVTATSSNTTLVPNNPANLAVTGAGSPRTLTITPAPNQSGTTIITVTVSNATSSISDTFTLTVNPVNDPPTANPQSVVTGEDTPVAILLSGNDVETPSPGLTYNITTPPANGVLSGSGNNRTYTPNLNFNGADSFQFTVTDAGDGSSPAITSAPATVSITVSPVNDAPVNTVPGTQSVVENSTLTFSATNSNAISISDVDAGSNPVQVSLASTHGTMTLSTLAGLSFTVGTGANNTAMTFTGTIASINNALNGLVYTPTPGYDGPASIQITTNDQGNTGSGGALSDTDTININVLDGGTLAFSSATYTVSESGGSATITVNRTGGANGEARVDYTTSNGTANALDYTTASGTLIFADGVTMQTFNVIIATDSTDEPDETVNLTLSNATGSGTLGSPSTAVLTITDDDPVPSISINDVSVAEGNSGTVNLVFTVSLSNPSSQTVTVNYVTADGTATAGSDYTAHPTTLLTFNPLETSKQITVVVNGDTDFELNEAFFVNLSSPSASATIADNQGQGLIINDDPVGGTITFSSATYGVNEDAGSVTITVNRTGTTTLPVTVDYATSDITATERKDYTTAVGTLNFPAGATSATFTVLVNIDSFAEGAELVGLTLSHATSGAGFGVPATASLQINNVPNALPNTIDDPAAFVDQHYHDFLNRVPDAPGRAHWINEITSCGADASCIEIRRINVSAAFFLSIEFQETGFAAYLTSIAAFGPTLPRYRDFMRDTQALQRGFVFGAPGSAAVLEANKVAFYNEYVTRPAFVALYSGLNNGPYVDALIANTGVPFTQAERDALVLGLSNFSETRATVLRKISEKASFKAAEFNRAFVLMQYFGYLRRNPDDLPDTNLDGYNFWLDKLNQFNGNFVQAEMVKAFISSIEYRERFGN